RDLERGDLVTIDVDDDSRGRRYARTVRVERSVRDSDRRQQRGNRIERFDGRVTWASADRGHSGCGAETPSTRCRSPTAAAMERTTGSADFGEGTGYASRESGRLADGSD